MHQIAAAADRDELDAGVGGLRAAAWPAPGDREGDDDAGLDGRGLFCDRLLGEVTWLRRCAGWLTRPRTSEYPWHLPRHHAWPAARYPWRAGQEAIAWVPR